MGDISFVEIPAELLPEAKDLPGDLSQIAEIVGVPKTVQLAQRFRGTQVYFCNVDTLIRKKRDNLIRSSYDQGVSSTKLARKHHLSERQIWRILGQT